MRYHIRPFTDEDAPDVGALLSAHWGHDPMMLAAYRMHRQWPETGHVRQTLVAIADGAVCGAGTIFQSSYHPAYPYVVINLSLAAQRQGIGTALLAELRQFAPGRRLTARALLGDTAGMNFLCKHGFAVVVHNSTGLLDPNQPAVRHWMEQLPAAVDGFAINAWEPRSGVTPLDLARCHEAVYAQFHAWNPPAALSDEAVRTRFFGEDVLDRTTLCVTQGDALCGAASLIRNPLAVGGAGARPEAYLVHIGIRGVAEAAAGALTAALIRHSLASAARLGYTVRFEADDTYRPHYELFAAAPATEVRRDLAALLTPA
jgi:GNAT superfamily N-acetyltransferase